MGITGTSTTRIYAISGQQVVPEFRQTSVSISLPRGIYIALIKNNGTLYRKKFIIF